LKEHIEFTRSPIKKGSISIKAKSIGQPLCHSLRITIMQMPFMAKDHDLGLYDDGVLVANLKEDGFDPNDDNSPLLMKGLVIVWRRWKQCTKVQRYPKKCHYAYTYTYNGVPRFPYTMKWFNLVSLWYVVVLAWCCVHGVTLQLFLCVVIYKCVQVQCLRFPSPHINNNDPCLVLHPINERTSHQNPPQ
jgi:hypothetical protein